MDERYVYGAYCCWHGPISSIATNGGLPCCPHCRGLLYEYPNKASWDRGVAAYEKQHPGYDAFQQWVAEQPTCYQNLNSAVLAYTAATGKTYKA